MGTIASSTFDRHGHTWDVRVLESGNSASKDLGITGLLRSQGEPGAQILSPILGTRVTLRLRDQNNYLLGRLSSAPLSDFSIEVDKDGSIWHHGPLTRADDRTDIAPSDAKLELQFGDQIGRLGNEDQFWLPRGADTPADPRSQESWRWEYLPSDQIYHKLGNVAPAILHTTTSLPSRTYSMHDHTGRDSSRNRIEGLRVRVNDLIRDQFPTTRLKALRRFCTWFGFQVVQHEGKWYVMERYSRGGSQDYAEYDTSFNSVASGNESNVVTLQDSEIRSFGERAQAINRLTRRPRYTEFGAQRLFEHADTDRFPMPSGADDPFSAPNTYPETDVWKNNGTNIDPNEVIFNQPGDTLERVEPYERPSNVSGMQIEVEVTLTVPSTATLPSSPNFEQVQIGTVYRKDESGVTTGALEVEIDDSDAGNTVTKSTTFGIPKGESARVKHSFESDPDNDGNTDVTEMRLKKSKATWPSDTPDAQRATGASGPQPEDRLRQDQACFGSYWNKQSGDEYYATSAGVIGVWNGSQYDELIDRLGWENRPKSTTEEFLNARRATLRAQMQPKTNPLVGWSVTQDLGATGDITSAFDYRGETHVPVYVKTDVLGGVRTVRMYELRT